MAAAGGGGWVEYWGRDDFWRDSPLWRMNAEVFFRRAGELVGLSGDDRVLNIGCGPGHLERLLAPRVAEVVAADVAGQFVEACRRACRGSGNVRVARLEGDYTDLSSLGMGFTLVLCVSVVQYYRAPKEMEALIASAERVAAPGARLLIADLPLRRGLLGFVWDGVCTLATGLSEGHLGLLLQSAASRWLRRSAYRDSCAANRQLSFTVAELEGLVARLNLDAQVVRRSLSIYANRPSLLIRLRAAPGRCAEEGSRGKEGTG